MEALLGPFGDVGKLIDGYIGEGVWWLGNANRNSLILG